MPTDTVKHPAKFSPEVMDAIGQITRRRVKKGEAVIDGFAGTGRIHRLGETWGWHTTGIEIEPEWANMDPRTIVGDATRLPFADGSFAAYITSPCLAQDHRVLTDDLRWVPVGDVEVGDELMAFDEEPRIFRDTGRAARRRWRRAYVVRSVPRTVDCVRVILANGDELVTTPEHPWLVSRYEGGGTTMEWVASRDLMGQAGRGDTKGHRSGARQPYFVHRNVKPWTTRTSFDAGWLSGMFDGEGSLSLGGAGAPKLTICQNAGPVLDRAERLMAEFGYEPNLIWRAGAPRKIGNLYVTGGFPGLMRALGELRPTRLMEKWQSLEVGSRTIQSERIAVVAVEPAGRRDIQEIETTEGTYFGEGYLHHNCYGNRMADHHDAKERCKPCDGVGLIGGETCSKCWGRGFRVYKRNTYKHTLGRLTEDGSVDDLHPRNTGAMQWGDDYRAMHALAWSEATRVTQRWLILNISDHYRKGKIIPVTAWHAEMIESLGWTEKDRIEVETPRNRQGENRELRVEFESVIAFRRR